MLLETSFRLLADVLGAGLHLFLVVLLARKRAAGLVERLALGAIGAAGLWHAANAAAIIHRAAAGHASSALLGVLNQVSIAALALLPAVLLHLGVAWSGVTGWAAAPGYAVTPLAWWGLESGRIPIYAGWLGMTLIGTAAFCLRAAIRGGAASTRRFHQSLAAALLATAAAGLLSGAGSTAVVIVSLGPPLVFAYFIYRYNLLGLLISRRIIFALKMGAIFAVYLLVVRQLARIAEDEFEAFGRLIEVALIFAAAIVWLPLYGWMSRFLSKRTGLYADFSKRVIEEAAGILDMQKRIQFLAEEVGRSFGLYRALLITSGESTSIGEFGPRAGEDPAFWPQLRRILSIVRARHDDLIHTATTGDAQLRDLLSGIGFNYLFPLWYEDHMTGLLLLDTSPRMFLDEGEAILLGLSRQISHSIETGRVIEEKIGLERALARQEHLATLGKVAATIAHEVKNPLSSIKTLAQLMREDTEVERRYARDLGFILSEVDRLNRTVQQLLSFSRPELEAEQEVNLSELLETTAGVLGRQYAAEQIRVEHRIEPGLKLRLKSTEALEQIVLNLAINAVQASAPSSAVCVAAGARPDGCILIAVTDQGPGIPPELREKVFEPFFTTKQKGTGLGLAIVKKNVRQLGGEIQVESPIAGGRGTRVTVVLPAG